MTWILILTLLAPAASGGSSITSVGGFHDKQSCVDAANLWLTNKPNGWSQASAICVQS